MIGVSVTSKFGGAPGAALESRLRRHVGMVAARLDAGIKAVATTLLAESRKLVPVDTTMLRQTSVAYAKSLTFPVVVWVVGYGPPGVRVSAPDKYGRMVVKEPFQYAKWVHQGYVHPITKQAIPAQPFLETARVSKFAEMRQSLNAVFHVGIGL